ncbi:CDP-alcohol phosphatidyltransferase family protein [Allokutzneria sp. A3M-2-11 16]|uniref:CDP-alcohol phosphatidyltransferase family protein n=1 Tax=Allokutzneria sp. A3M-2-11 16 TaxID=2962043 RepID=UPI0020B80C77|nr:CDP-alcohol phosphatidyltransferase family protein [Allokutzneria sp. A3M-2-11 16]MCP3802133.1 CDP-alcohol phosphatidyltransferase family protein [Allokutzneria sp. A3M-2-11 16]
MEREAATAAPSGGELPQSDRVWTIPNILSMLRLAGVPLFLWLLLGPREDVLAIIVLAVGGFTDWLDGKLARWLNQGSKLGAMLDPAADRLYILATLIAFGIREILPWWVILALVGRELVLGLSLLVLRRYGYGPFEVHYTGKAATFVLLYAFPFLLGADGTSALAEVVRPIAYGFTIWGVLLYLWAGVLYLIQLAAAIRKGKVPGALAGA